MDIDYKLATSTLLRSQENVKHIMIITTCDKKLWKLYRNEAGDTGEDNKSNSLKLTEGNGTLETCVGRCALERVH